MCLLVRDSTAARLPVMVINVLVGEGGGVWFGVGLGQTDMPRCCCCCLVLELEAWCALS